MAAAKFEIFFLYSDDEIDGSASAKIRQRSASTAPKEGGHNHHQSSTLGLVSTTPPTFKESRFFHGNRHKSPHLTAAFPSLHKSVSTPSIVVDQNLGHPRKKYAQLFFFLKNRPQCSSRNVQTKIF